MHYDSVLCYFEVPVLGILLACIPSAGVAFN